MTGIEIKPDVWYSERELRMWGFEEAELAKARKAGVLKSREAGKGRGVDRLYKGEWLLAWLEGEASK